MRNRFLMALAIAAASMLAYPQLSHAQAPPTGGQGQTKGDRDQGGQTQGGQTNKGGQTKEGQTQGQADRTQTDRNSADRTGLNNANMSVTGCLQRGQGRDAYTITGADGKRYDLKTSNSSVKFDDHVGHRVTIMGGQGTNSAANPNSSQNTTKSDQSRTEQPRTDQPRAETQDRTTPGQSSSTTSAGNLEVTSLTMISSTCQ